jgi:hypothetical protein
MLVMLVISDLCCVSGADFQAFKFLSLNNDRNHLPALGQTEGKTPNQPSDKRYGD